MFQLLTNLYHHLKAKSERKLTLAVLGIDNAGKTTLINTIRGELDAEVTPTFGFNSHSLTEGKYKLEVFDLGGGKSIRRVWKSYLAEVHAVVYVVDAADPGRFEEARTTLESTLADAHLADKPVLVLANKQDLPTAAAAVDVAKALGLADRSTAGLGASRRFQISPCTAKTPAGQLADPRVREAVRWLVGQVDAVFTKLDPRVKVEAEAARQEELRRKKEREEQARKAREERQRQQQEREKEEAAAAEAARAAEAVPFAVGAAAAAAGTGRQETENLLRDGVKQPLEGSPARALVLAGVLPNQIESPKPAIGGLVAPASAVARADSPARVPFSDVLQPPPPPAAAAAASTAAGSAAGTGPASGVGVTAVAGANAAGVWSPRGVVEGSAAEHLLATSPTLLYPGSAPGAASGRSSLSAVAATNSSSNAVTGGTASAVGLSTASAAGKTLPPLGSHSSSLKPHAAAASLGPAFELAAVASPPSGHSAPAEQQTAVGRAQVLPLLDAERSDSGGESSSSRRGPPLHQMSNRVVPTG